MTSVTRIHQIEVTTECNLRCKYCPHPNLPREKRHMDMETFARALKWCEFYDQTTGNQTELSLTGIGESLLHPHLLDFCAMARDALPGARLLFSTNGLLLTDHVARGLRDCGVVIDISLHRPEKAGPAIQIAKRHGILNSVNPAATTSSFDWAGFVDWPVTAKNTVCYYLQDGWGCVLVDGRITTCCMDYDGSGVVGHVDDEIGARHALEEYRLCESCYLRPS